MEMEKEEAKGKKKREKVRAGGRADVGDGQPIKRLHLIIK